MTRLTRRFELALVAIPTCVFLAACTRPAPPTGLTAAKIEADQLEPLWDATLSVLRKHDFLPDRQDRAQGVITTLPSTSRQWGEVWRHDLADNYSKVESSMHTVQRQVTVRFVKSPEWSLSVQVDVFRLNVPESQITTASSAFQAFSGALPDTEGSQQISGVARGRNWVPKGRDAAMEDRLLNRILATAG